MVKVFKSQTKLSNIFYCSIIKVENICQTRLSGHHSLKIKYLYNFSYKLFLKIDNDCLEIIKLLEETVYLY